MTENEFYTYILWSKTIEKYYVGSTKNVIRRIQNHRMGLSKWTSKATDWILIYSTSFEMRTEALNLEKRIKKRGAKRWLQDKNLMNYVRIAQSG